jgi:hypothetical protein
MLQIDRHITRSSVIVLIAIIALAASGFVLQTVRASDEAALVEDIATHVKLNRIELQRLQGELDQLQQQLSSVTTSLRINYEYLRMRYTSGNGRMERRADSVLTRKPIVIKR